MGYFLTACQFFEGTLATQVASSVFDAINNATETDSLDGIVSDSEEEGDSELFSWSWAPKWLIDIKEGFSQANSRLVTVVNDEVIA